MEQGYVKSEKQAAKLSRGFYCTYADICGTASFDSSD